MGRLDNKIAVVTGATSGIGQATARLFAEEGATVVMGARREDRGKAMEDELKAAGHEAMFVRTDVSKAEDCANLIEETVKKYGRIDILVNVSGTTGNGFHLLHESDEEERDRLIKVNLYSVIETCKAAIPHMLEQGKGSIVNVASVSAIVASPMNTLYSASKGAVKMLTVSMAADYAATGVRINGVCPGLTRTEMVPEGNDEFEKMVLPGIPQHRLADPKEIAYGILFMASDEASFCTGHMLVIDGGESIS